MRKSANLCILSLVSLRGSLVLLGIPNSLLPVVVVVLTSDLVLECHLASFINHNFKSNQTTVSPFSLSSSSSSKLSTKLSRIRQSHRSTPTIVLTRTQICFAILRQRQNIVGPNSDRCLIVFLKDKKIVKVQFQPFKGKALTQHVMFNRFSAHCTGQ